MYHSLYQKYKQRYLGLKQQNIQCINNPTPVVINHPVLDNFNITVSRLDQDGSGIYRDPTKSLPIALNRNNDDGSRCGSRDKLDESRYDEARRDELDDTPPTTVTDDTYHLPKTSLFGNGTTYPTESLDDDSTLSMAPPYPDALWVEGIHYPIDPPKQYVVLLDNINVLREPRKTSGPVLTKQSYAGPTGQLFKFNKTADGFEVQVKKNESYLVTEAVRHGMDIFFKLQDVDGWICNLDDKNKVVVAPAVLEPKRQWSNQQQQVYRTTLETYLQNIVDVKSKPPLHDKPAGMFAIKAHGRLPSEQRHPLFKLPEGVVLVFFTRTGISVDVVSPTKLMGYPYFASNQQLCLDHDKTVPVTPALLLTSPTTPWKLLTDESKINLCPEVPPGTFQYQKYPSIETGQLPQPEKLKQGNWSGPQPTLSQLFKDFKQGILNWSQRSKSRQERRVQWQRKELDTASQNLSIYGADWITDTASCFDTETQRLVQSTRACPELILSFNGSQPPETPDEPKQLRAELPIDFWTQLDHPGIPDAKRFLTKIIALYRELSEPHSKEDMDEKLPQLNEQCQRYFNKFVLAGLDLGSDLRCQITSWKYALSYSPETNIDDTTMDTYQLSPECVMTCQYPISNYPGLITKIHHKLGAESPIFVAKYKPFQDFVMKCGVYPLPSVYLQQHAYTNNFKPTPGDDPGYVFKGAFMPRIFSNLSGDTIPSKIQPKSNDILTADATEYLVSPEIMSNMYDWNQEASKGPQSTQVTPSADQQLYLSELVKRLPHGTAKNPVVYFVQSCRGGDITDTQVRRNLPGQRLARQFSEQRQQQID